MRFVLGLFTIFLANFTNASTNLNLVQKTKQDFVSFAVGFVEGTLGQQFDSIASCEVGGIFEV